MLFSNRLPLKSMIIKYEMYEREMNDLDHLKTNTF